MSTKVTKKRISITTDKDLESAIAFLARRDGMPVTTKATELLRFALELEEDEVLVALANERSKTSKEKFIPYDESIWKQATKS